MKDRKHMSHNDLVHEVTSQLSTKFHPDPLSIKRRVEHLIEVRSSSHTNPRWRYWIYHPERVHVERRWPKVVSLYCKRSLWSTCYHRINKSHHRHNLHYHVVSIVLYNSISYIHWQKDREGRCVLVFLPSSLIDKLGQVYIYNIRHQSSSRVLVGDTWKASLISVENEQCQ